MKRKQDAIGATGKDALASEVTSSQSEHLSRFRELSNREKGKMAFQAKAGDHYMYAHFTNLDCQICRIRVFLALGFDKDYIENELNMCESFGE